MPYAADADGSRKRILHGPEPGRPISPRGRLTFSKTRKKFPPQILRDLLVGVAAADELLGHVDHAADVVAADDPAAAVEIGADADVVDADRPS